MSNVNVVGDYMVLDGLVDVIDGEFRAMPPEVKTEAAFDKWLESLFNESDVISHNLPFM